MQNQKKADPTKKADAEIHCWKMGRQNCPVYWYFWLPEWIFWHWTIALPTPTSHLAMLHSKIILSDPNRRVKVVLIGFFLFWSRCRTWGTSYFFTTSSFRWSWRSSSTTSAANPMIPGRFSRPPFRGYLKRSVLYGTVKIQICKNTQRKYRKIGLAGACFALVLMATLGLILVLIAVHRIF